MFRTHKSEILTILLCSILVGSAYAALATLWSAPSSATITTSVPYIQVVDAYDNNVTEIDFGHVAPSSDINIRLDIKNTSPNATITINWSSTVGSVTTKITNHWDIPYAGFPYALQPGQKITTYYHIVVASDCPQQDFSWQLSIVPG